MIQIIKNLSKEDNQKLILTILLGLCEDKSWKVRLSIAKNFADIATAFGKEITDGSLVVKLAGLLKDVEADVRTAAVLSLKACSKNISPDKIQTHLLPPLSTLTQDASFNVKGKSYCEII